MSHCFDSPIAQKRLASIQEFIERNDKPSNRDMMPIFGLDRITMQKYLARLEFMGLAHPVSRSNRADGWAPGPVPAVADSEYDQDGERDSAPLRRFVAAKQVGVVRDALIAALFGPAGAQVSA